MSDDEQATRRMEEEDPGESRLLDEYERVSFEIHLRRAMLGRSLSYPSPLSSSPIITTTATTPAAAPNYYSYYSTTSCAPQNHKPAKQDAGPGPGPGPDGGGGGGGDANQQRRSKKSRIFQRVVKMLIIKPLTLVGTSTTRMFLLRKEDMNNNATINHVARSRSSSSSSSSNKLWKVAAFTRSVRQGV